MKHNRLKFAHPDYEPPFPEFWFLFLVLSAIAFIFGTIGSIADFQLVWPLITVPMWGFLGWFLLMCNHEAAHLEGVQLKLYDAYWKLSDKTRKALPKLPVEKIRTLNEQVCVDMKSAFEDLRSTEQAKARAQEALDPFPTDMIRSIREAQKVAHEEVRTLNKVKRELDT